MLRCALLLALEATPIVAGPPDTSLRTIPVAYYGANWNRSQVNLEMLSKQRIVVLMQEDGGCWLKCCPDVVTHGIGACQDHTTIDRPYNASLNLGCNPTCDQHGKQTAVFHKVKDVAKTAGREAPHCMLYMNAVYDWPFDAAHAAGAEATDVLDVNGKPHAEVSDPGIYPSYLLDYGREVGRKAFADSVTRYVVKGAADGVFLDNFAEVPMRCDRRSGACTASRNQWASKANVPSNVTAEQVEAYTVGKNKSLSAAGSIIKSTNGAFAAFTYGNSPNAHGANMAWINMHPAQGGNASVLIDFVKETLQNGYHYLGINWHRFRFPTTLDTTDPDMVKSVCSEYQIATFLLAWEVGCFLICNGWSDDFDRPVGAPVGPAAITKGVMARSFSSGLKVEWVLGTQNTTISWGSQHMLV
jgi:hypothetical protein